MVVCPFGETVQAQENVLQQIGSRLVIVADRQRGAVDQAAMTVVNHSQCIQSALLTLEDQFLVALSFDHRLINLLLSCQKSSNSSSLFYSQFHGSQPFTALLPSVNANTTHSVQDGQAPGRQPPAQHSRVREYACSR